MPVSNRTWLFMISYPVKEDDANPKMVECELCGMREKTFFPNERPGVQKT